MKPTKEQKIVEKVAIKTEKLLEKYSTDKVCSPGIALTVCAYYLLTHYKITEKEMIKSLKASLEIMRKGDKENE